MDRTASNISFRHSLWDRLTDPDPIAGARAEGSRSAEAARLKREVLTHLEWLLNTRRHLPDSAGGSATLRDSLLGYGLPDITGLRSGTAKGRERLENLLRDAIQRFEPRLEEVRIEFNPRDQDRSRAALHYRVSAILKVQPFVQPILFDTMLELGNKSFLVRGRD